MIAGTGWTNNDQTTVTDFRIRRYQLTTTSGGYEYNGKVTITEKTVTQLSLERLLKLMFIPVKVPINRTYNPKHHKLTTRNNLPQRIRLNEKAES